MLKIVLKIDLFYNLDSLTDEEKFKRVTVEAIFSRKHEWITDDELALLSNKFNIPSSKLATVIYDYHIWTKAEEVAECGE